jgi:hypothetical protein
VKANFPLSDIELNIEDDIIALAEELSPLALDEVEKNLWLAHFEELSGGNVETEIQLNGVKVKNFTCDCAIFKAKTICPHVAATLLALLKRRQILQEAKAAKQKAVKLEAETPSRLTIPNILKKVEATQLIEFIADYARQDKQFALALKTRFTGNIMTGDFVEHYKTLIDNTLRTAKNPKGKLTPKGWLQFFTMLDELRQKAEGHFKTGELSTAFELIKLSVPLVHRYLRASDSPKTKLEKRQAQFGEILRGYAEVLVSPELAENIWDFTLAEFAQNAKFTFSNILFDWLLYHADSKIRTDAVIQIIENQIVATRGKFDLQDRLLTQKIQFLQKTGRVEEASDMILGASQNPEVLFFAVQNSIENRDFILAKSLCLNGLKMYNKPALTDQIENYLLEIAQKESDTEGVLFYAEKRFLASLNLDYLAILKRYKIYENKFQKLTQTVENQPYRIEKRDALAAIYSGEKQYDKLLDFIKSLQSIELLRRYGVELWRVDPIKALDLHKNILYEYLYSHLGRPPAQRIRSILENHIEKNGMALAEMLIADLKKDFPERYSLKEEMDNMLADLKINNYD